MKGTQARRAGSAGKRGSRRPPDFNGKEGVDGSSPDEDRARLALAGTTGTPRTTRAAFPRDRDTLTSRCPLQPTRLTARLVRALNSPACRPARQMRVLPA